MRSPAAILVLAASLFAIPAAAEPPPASPIPVPAPVAVPAPAPAPYATPVYTGPPWWALPPRVMERRSKALMGIGIALWGAGAIVAAVGAVIFIPAATSQCSFVAGAGSSPGAGPGPSPPRRAHRGGGERVGTAQQALGCGSQDDANFNLGTALFAGGILGSMAGIPLFVVGNSKVPAGPRNESTFVPDLRVGAGRADLRWAF